jgi:hypothetical protein
LARAHALSVIDELMEFVRHAPSARPLAVTRSGTYSMAPADRASKTPRDGSPGGLCSTSARGAVASSEPGRELKRRS